MVLQRYTFAGLFMSAPLQEYTMTPLKKQPVSNVAENTVYVPEYTISGSYSSDRLRGAQWALLADWLLLIVTYLPVVFP